jgi:hypothetical protein
MAIQDRNLSVGTKLYARYKGATHTAEVIEKEGKPVYRLADGREFKSPSAAGTAITGLACNGWAFWSVGEPPIEAEPEQPKTKTKTAKTPNAPRAKKAKAKSDAPAEPFESPDGTVGTHANGKLACEVCGAEFDDEGAVTAHYMEQHAS